MSEAIPIGRFAPSPSGPLHFGSLVCALASYLDMKRQGGKWLVRMEDIDPPREVKGASDHILKQLEAHGLLWDDEVLYQSSRLDNYAEIVNDLKKQDFAYNCECSRKRITELNGIYDGHCRPLNLSIHGNGTRLHLKPSQQPIEFTDQIIGHYSQHLDTQVGDFIVRRRDGLFSYQLAVTVDDHFQGITHIMRGSDLLDSTPRQIYLQKILGYSQPQYAHLPVANNEWGQKLSKQNLAAGLPYGQEAINLWVALNWLKQSPPNELRQLTIGHILTWAIDHWDQTQVPAKLTLTAPDGF